MLSHKLSISIPEQQYDFIEKYKERQHYANTSKVIQEAINLLQQNYLESCYQEANKELNNDLDIAISDGLDNETW